MHKLHQKGVRAQQKQVNLYLWKGDINEGFFVAFNWITCLKSTLSAFMRLHTNSYTILLFVNLIHKEVKIVHSFKGTIDWVLCVLVNIDKRVITNIEVQLLLTIDLKTWKDKIFEALSIQMMLSSNNLPPSFHYLHTKLYQGDTHHTAT
jgi:hypothetical protein